MARLFPLVIIVTVVAGLAWLLRRLLAASAPPAASATYRPKARWRPADAARARQGAVQVMTRGELAGLRDAYSSAPINPDGDLLSCARCHAMYHRASMDELKHDNAGRCVVCSGTEFGPVRLTDGH